MQHVGLIDNNKCTEKDDSRTDNQLLRAVSEPLPGPSGITDKMGNQSEQNQHEWSWTNGQSKKTVKSLQSEDPAISPIWQAKVQNSKPSASTTAKFSPAARHYSII